MHDVDINTEIKYAVKKLSHINPIVRSVFNLTKLGYTYENALENAIVELVKQNQDYQDRLVHALNIQNREQADMMNKEFD